MSGIEFFSTHTDCQLSQLATLLTQHAVESLHWNLLSRQQLSSLAQSCFNVPIADKHMHLTSDLFVKSTASCKEATRTGSSIQYMYMGTIQTVLCICRGEDCPHQDHSKDMQLLYVSNDKSGSVSLSCLDCCYRFQMKDSICKQESESDLAMPSRKHLKLICKTLCLRSKHYQTTAKKRSPT